MIQRYSVVQIVRNCGECKDLSQGKWIHGHIARHHPHDRYFHNLLIEMYGKCGSLEDAFIAFGKIQDPNVFSWNLIVQACTRNDNLQRGRSLFDKMPFRDEFSWNIITQAYADHGLIENAKTMFDQMPEWSVVSWTIIVAMYAQAGHLGSAMNAFQAMPVPNAVSWTVILSGYVMFGQVYESWSWFWRMLERNVVSWTTMLSALGHSGHFDESRATFYKMPKWNMVSCNAVINACVQNGQSITGKEIFYQMAERNIVSWTTLAAGFAELQQALRIFQKMPGHNAVACAAMILRLAERGYLSESIIIFRSLPVYNAVTWNAMIQAYARNGHLDKAGEMFVKLPHRDESSWTALIAAYAHNGCSEDAIKLFHFMNFEGFRPDATTFNSVLSACSHLGIPNQSRDYFISMIEDQEILPRIEHYTCMVDILGRSGRLDDAEDLVNNMPYEPHEVTWTALLGACKVYGELTRGEGIACRAIAMEPSSQALYMLLLNMYAAVGRQEDAARVRNLMIENGVVKKQGCSIIEVGNVVHEFTVTDMLHPQTKEIHTELKRLGVLLKKAGFVPDTKQVLHDVGDSEKQLMLSCHSEKLAVAFGMISTEPGTPLRIINTLRMCPDCHTAMKFFSKIFDREIFVRDTNLFHHFRNGFCSCRDYW